MVRIFVYFAIVSYKKEEYYINFGKSFVFPIGKLIYMIKLLVKKIYYEIRIKLFTILK